ncbi:hypothetical protein Nmel_012026 [Mimus melanotis]
MATRRAALREQDPDPDPDWAGMAALPEKTMNGWVLQFYFHRAIEAYRSGRNRDFRQFRDIMQALLVRPLNREPEMAQMLRIMQLLSRVEEGENLGRCPALPASSGEPRCCLQPAPSSPRPVPVSLHSRSFVPAQSGAVGVPLRGSRAASVALRGWHARQTHQPGDSCLASQLPKCSLASVLGTWEILECCFQNFLHLLWGRNCSSDTWLWNLWHTCAGGWLPPVQVNNQLSLGKRRDPPPNVWMPILIDCTFDKESELTPLESAMLVLDFIREEFSVPDKTMEAVQKMVKEAAVVVCIRNKEFEKASNIVKKHMGKEARNQVSLCWDEVGADVSWEVWGEEARMETIPPECWSLSVACLSCHPGDSSVTHLSSHTFMGLPGIIIYPLMSLQLTFRADSGSSRSSHSCFCRQ